jgi:hypothetical protein
MIQKLKPVIIAHELQVQEIFFDLTLIVNKQNEITVVDNSIEDYKDFLDCNTLIMKKVKVEI